MATISFHSQTVEALNALAERLGISKEEVANNAILVYRDMILSDPQTQSSEARDDFLSSTDLGRQLKRWQRQWEIEDEERDIAFHREHNRPYTPIR